MIRKTPLRILALLFVVMFVAVPVFAADAEAPAEPATLKVGDVITDDVQVTTVDGQTVTLKSQCKSPYNVFQFMTTACSGCQTELNKLLQLQMEMGKTELAIYPILLDMVGADAAKAYEAKNNYGLEYLLDQKFMVPPRFGFAYTPSFLIADSTGKVLFLKGGFIESRWEQDLKKIKAVLK
jgi:peroxiredoxin